MNQHPHPTLSCAYALGTKENVDRGFESVSEHVYVLFHTVPRRL
jgi:hypothetical protein